MKTYLSQNIVRSMIFDFQAMCNEFNELRSEMVLLYELKNALAACEQELHSLKGQFEAACPGKVGFHKLRHKTQIS